MPVAKMFHYTSVRARWRAVLAEQSLSRGTIRPVRIPPSPILNWEGRHPLRFQFDCVARRESDSPGNNLTKSCTEDATNYHYPCPNNRGASPCSFRETGLGNWKCLCRRVQQHRVRYWFPLGALMAGLRSWFSAKVTRNRVRLRVGAIRVGADGTYARCR
jgi:hypothetical protein